jgi:signal transduction histidine kinase
MEAGARDDTQDWLLPKAAAPPTVAQLEARIDEAVDIARSSEAAAMTVADAAIESAEQARRAADLAERASKAALAAGSSHRIRGPLAQVGARLARLQRR